MILSIDHTSATPIYRQIRDRIVEAIARGELVAGDGLPSVRRLASDLGINLHTVNKAYAVLRDEGHLVIRGRNGAFVADAARSASEARRASAEAELEDALVKLAFEHKARGGEESSFLCHAANAAHAVYSDPGIAGARRTVRVAAADKPSASGATRASTAAAQAKRGAAEGV